MSRIHEALKKAASERAAQLEGKPLIEQVEIAGDTLVEDALDVRLPREARKGMVELGEPEHSNWDKLAEKCKHSEWKIDLMLQRVRRRDDFSPWS